MGFFKKRGKPRQYRVVIDADHKGAYYVLEAWNRGFRFWEFVALRGDFNPYALAVLRTEAAREAKVKGYGDNYEITELI